MCLVSREIGKCVKTAMDVVVYTEQSYSRSCR